MNIFLLLAISIFSFGVVAEEEKVDTQKYFLLLSASLLSGVVDAKISADCEGATIKEDDDLLLSADCKKVLDSTSTAIQKIFDSCAIGKIEQQACDALELTSRQISQLEFRRKDLIKQQVYLAED